MLATAVCRKWLCTDIPRHVGHPDVVNVRAIPCGALLARTHFYRDVINATAFTREKRYTMKPPGYTAPDGQEPDSFITKLDVERLASPISVVQGYTQILQRRIRSGKPVEEKELLRMLGLIEEASRLLTTRLVAIRAGLDVSDD